MFKTKMQGRFSLYFGFLMVPLYLGAAVYVFVSKDLNLQPDNRYLFSFILLCYGVLRAYRGVVKFKKNAVEGDL